MKYLILLLAVFCFSCKGQSGKYVITQSGGDDFDAHYYVDTFKFLPNGCLEFTTSSYKPNEHKVICGTFNLRER